MYFLLIHVTKLSLNTFSFPFWSFSVQWHAVMAIKHVSSSVQKRYLKVLFWRIFFLSVTWVESYSSWHVFSGSLIKDTAGKYRELAAKKCHHVPKPIVELQRSCNLAECPARTTPPVHRWATHHRTQPPQPLPRPEWQSSPWSQVNSHGNNHSEYILCRYSFVSANWQERGICNVI